jgi:hypothetical protein
MISNPLVINTNTSHFQLKKRQISDFPPPTSRKAASQRAGGASERDDRERKDRLLLLRRISSILPTPCPALTLLFELLFQFVEKEISRDEDGCHNGHLIHIRSGDFFHLVPFAAQLHTQIVKTNSDSGITQVGKPFFNITQKLKGDLDSGFSRIGGRAKIGKDRLEVDGD